MWRYLKKIGLALLIIGPPYGDRSLQEAYIERYPGEGRSRPLVVIGGVLLGFGLINIVIAIAFNHSQIRTGFWPTTAGLIEVSESRRFRSGPASAQVSYSYEVDGRRYSSSRITTRDSSYEDIRFAMEAADRFPVGETVTVSYNRRNPSEAVLEAGYDLLADWFFVIGLCLSTVGLGCFVMQLGRQAVRGNATDPFKSPDRMP